LQKSGSIGINVATETAMQKEILYRGFMKEFCSVLLIRNLSKGVIDRRSEGDAIIGCAGEGELGRLPS